MADILIRGMEMPQNCATCDLFGEYGCAFIGAVGYALTQGRRNEDCPLHELPPHGDLIDRRELLSTVMQVVTKFPTSNIAAIEHLDLVSALLRGATVVVPAERSEP